MFISLQDRYRGCFVGLAVGDALGAPYEFLEKEEVKYNHQMNAGGFFNLPKGAYTDDTTMNICLAESILTKDFDMYDQMNRYIQWYTKGMYSSTKTCFDIGNQTQYALEYYIQNSKFIFEDEKELRYSKNSSGNGSLMRIAPIAMAYNDLSRIMYYAKESSITTHTSNKCVGLCINYAQMIRLALNGKTKDEIVSVDKFVKNIQLTDLCSSGYVLDSYRMCTYAFLHTSTFEDCMQFIIEQGGDADTNACIAGMLAGAYYGIDSIPAIWVEELMDNKLMFSYADRLLEYSKKEKNRE